MLTEQTRIDRPATTASGGRWKLQGFFFFSFSFLSHRWLSGTDLKINEQLWNAPVLIFKAMLSDGVECDFHTSDELLDELGGSRLTRTAPFCLWPFFFFLQIETSLKRHRLEFNLGTEKINKWKPLRMDCRGSITTVQPQTRLREMDTENCFLIFHSPFPLSTDSVSFGPRTQSLAIVRRSITLHAGTSCEAFTWLRSKISWDIWQISSEIGDSRRRSRRKLWKKLDTAGRFESFFSCSLERERSAGETAHRCRHTGASVFHRRQKFCDSAARLDGLAKLSSRSNGLEGQIEPEIKRCGPTRVGADA